MSNVSIAKKIALSAATAGLFAASQGAFAHTGVRDVVNATNASTTTSWNAFTITHGCSAGEGGVPIPVIGQSAVFPYGETAVWKKLSDGSSIDPLSVIGVDAADFNLSVAGIQDAAIWSVQNEEADADDVVHALNWKGGTLKTELYGLTQFRVTVPKIVDGCVANLRIRIAVANWCKKNANEANNPEDNRADWWFTAETGTTSFTDPGIIQPTYWATLTAKNTTPSCGSTPYDVAVMPSGADIDKWLPHPGFTKAPAPY